MYDTRERCSPDNSYILFHTIFKCYNCSNFMIIHYYIGASYIVFTDFFLMHIGIVSVTDGRRRGLEANDQ